MYKACKYCGRIHTFGYICPKKPKRTIYRGGEERKLRSTNAWTKKSKEIREKAQGLCEVCRDKGTYTYASLEVHHIVKLRHRPDLLLDNYNLIALCEDCHKKADSGKISTEYLQSLARKRECNNEKL